MTRGVHRPEQGFVAIEWVLAVAVLLLPVAVLVATLPSWVQRRHAATVAAREVATAVVQDPSFEAGAAAWTADEVAANYGIAPEDIDVRVHAASGRGEYVGVEVRVRMPALSVPGLVEAGAWTFTTSQQRRLDDYRSR
jgi:hypothetical protein